jgi:hypothetical protein
MVIGDEFKSQSPKYMRPKIEINASGKSRNCLFTSRVSVVRPSLSMQNH